MSADPTARRSAPRKPKSVAGALGMLLLAAATSLGSVDASAAKAWPNASYRDTPVEFFRTELGVEPWSKQIEVIEALRDHPAHRVAVKAGHKVSKSHTAGGIALWFYSLYDDARVVMTSTTSRQVDQILWRELRMMHARSGRCVMCKRAEANGPKPCPHATPLDGEPMQLARSGLKSGFREVLGFTAREPEAVAGVSSPHLLYIVDEASGVADEIFEAIEGNRAGGAWILLLSNPTRTEGEFFEAFNAKADFYRTVSISSEDSPNVIEGREVIPGLATQAWVEEKTREWGVDSALFQIRVRGNFVLKEDGKIISVHTIGEAEKRWHETEADGRLHIGLDPAGPGGAGDESAYAVRRGMKVLEILTFRGLTDEAHLVHLQGTIKKHRTPRDLPPIVTLDREGPIGSSLYGFLLGHVGQFREDRQPFEVVGVRSSDRAHREPMNYDRLRDELWASMGAWLRDGGAIPEDTKLAKELHAPEWIPQINNRLKATPKDELKKKLGRSPDRADAVALSIWESSALRQDRADAGASADDVDSAPIDPHGGYISPYGGA